MEEFLRNATPYALGLTAVIIAVVFLLGLIIRLPRKLVDEDINLSPGSQPTPGERVQTIATIRHTMVQAAGGLLLAAGVFFTWSQIQVSREGQVTERFTKAV